MTELTNAQFTTVINVPPDAAPRSIEMGTQLNLFVGGRLDDLFSARSDSELNVLGGIVGDFLRARAGSVVNISSGTVGGLFTAQSGSEINMSGGTILGGLNVSGTVKVTDGTLTAFEIYPGGSMDVQGGSIGLFVTTFAGGQLKLVGGDFQADGMAQVRL